MIDHKSDIEFLLFQLSLMEHDQDRAEIAAVAKRHGVAFPMTYDPRQKQPRLKAKERRHAR